MSRTFTSKPAVREAVPLLLGIVGVSGAGKTMSALRLATGIQRVCPGDIYVIDTESRRALAYAEEFQFQHLEFKEPFGPMDYLAAIDHCVDKGAKTIIVDSMSHEWEGPGGVLEMREAEEKRMAGDDWKKRDRVKFATWIKPKREHQRLKNSLLQRDVNFIFCFRAKEKIKPMRGKDPVHLGWQAIGAEDMVYELAVSCLLLPGAGGKPTWRPEHEGERQMAKLPEWAKKMFKDGAVLDEATGERLAQWSAGGEAPAPKSAPTANSAVAALIARYEACGSREEHDGLEEERRELWPLESTTAKDKRALKAASDAASVRLKEKPPCEHCGYTTSHAPACPELAPT